MSLRTSCSNLWLKSVTKIDTIVLLINSWSKSFYVVDKTVIQLSMMLVRFGMCIR